MITIKVFVDNGEEDEVLLEVCNGDVRLYVFSYPYPYERDVEFVVEELTLSTLYASNIKPVTNWYPPYRIPELGYYDHHICAQIVNQKEGRVRVGDIDLIVDELIDCNYSVGSFVSFNATRVDFFKLD